MYGKHYAAMYSGSMVGSGATVFAVWGYIIAHTRVSDNSIEINPRVLSTIIGEPVDDVEKAIEFLCSPDKHSRSKEHEGRRLLQEAPFLYHVVNFAKYNALKDEDSRREYMRLYMKERRKKSKPVLNGVNNGKPELSEISHADADAEVNTEAKKQQPSSPDGDASKPALKSTGSNSRQQAEAVYAEYPRKVGKEEALKSIGRLIASKKKTFDELLSITKIFAQSKLGKGEGYHDAWHPATFYNQGHYDDDQTEWNKTATQNGHPPHKSRASSLMTVSELEAAGLIPRQESCDEAAERLCDEIAAEKKAALREGLLAIGNGGVPI